MSEKGTLPARRVRYPKSEGMPVNGAWLRKKRQEWGLSQRELARKIGVGRLSIQRVETGKQHTLPVAAATELHKLFGEYQSGGALYISPEMAYELVMTVFVHRDYADLSAGENALLDRLLNQVAVNTHDIELSDTAQVLMALRKSATEPKS